MKFSLSIVLMVFLIPFIQSQTSGEWIERAEAAEAEARAAGEAAERAASEGDEREAANKKLEAQNAWREAGSARSSAAEKLVEEEDYEEAAEQYEKAGDHFERAGNEAQAASEREKAESNYKTAADQALAGGDETESERLRKRAEAVNDEAEEPVVETKAVPERAFDAVVTKARGTGQTTGHIATISVRNNSDKQLQISPQIFYIPSDGRFQSYVGRIPPGNAISPGERVNVPVYGYCTDISKPPVPLGSGMPNRDSWVPVSDGATPAGGNVFQIVPGPTQASFEPGDIADLTNSQGFQEEQPSMDGGFQASWPGTDQVVEGTIRIDDHPDQFGPVIVSIVEQIESAADYLIENGLVTTPFSGDPERESEAIIQQTIWYTVGLFTGNVYTKDDFEEKVSEELALSTGTTVSDLPGEEQDRFSNDVQNFWNSFTATGLEAKVIRDQSGSASGSTTVPKGTTQPQYMSVAESAPDDCELIIKDRGTKEVVDVDIAETGSAEDNEEVYEEFRAVVKEVAGIASSAEADDSINIGFTSPAMPASAWSVYIPHVVGSRANATAFGIDPEDLDGSAWTTEPIKTEAEGEYTVILTHLIGEDCNSTLIGLNFAEVKANAGMDQTLGNVMALRITNFVGELAIDYVLTRGKGKFAKLSKYLKDKVKDLTKDKAKEVIEEELKRLSDEWQGKSDEEIEQSMEELVGELQSGEVEQEDSDFLEDWIAERIVEGDEFDPEEKIKGDIKDQFDSPVDWSPIKTNTYAVSEGTLDIFVEDNHGRASAASGVQYKREEFESEEEAVTGGGTHCSQSLVTEITSGQITLRTQGTTRSDAGATGEGIIKTGHGSATSILESFNGLYVIALCECPSGLWYDRFASSEIFSTDEVMASIWNKVFMNLMEDVYRNMEERVDALPGNQREFPEDFATEIQSKMEQAARRASHSILPCEQ